MSGLVTNIWELVIILWLVPLEAVVVDSYLLLGGPELPHVTETSSLEERLDEGSQDGSI